MLAIRNIRLSVRKNLSDLFASARLFATPFTVYGESAVRDEAFVGVRPFVVIIDSRVLFETRHLPLIVVETSTARFPLELGRSAFWATVQLNVFGRNRGERDDIASAIMQGIDRFAMYDFSDGVPVFLGESPLEGDWVEANLSVTTNVAVEGSLTNWTQLSAAFPVIAYE